MKLTFEAFESFLADQPAEKIVSLCTGDGSALLAYLKAEYGKMTTPRELAPDTWEANEAATVDGDRSDRADQKVAELKDEAPQVWEMIKDLIPKNTKDILRGDLERMEPW